MDNKEAIEVLKDINEYSFLNKAGEPKHEAIQHAITALQDIDAGIYIRANKEDVDENTRDE